MSSLRLSHRATHRSDRGASAQLSARSIVSTEQPPLISSRYPSVRPRSLCSARRTIHRLAWAARLAALVVPSFLHCLALIVIIVDYTVSLRTRKCAGPIVPNFRPSPDIYRTSSKCCLIADDFRCFPTIPLFCDRSLVR